MIFLNFTDIASILQLEKQESDYPAISVIERSALTAIEEYLFRGLELTNETETFSARQSDLGFNRYPIASLNSVVRNSISLVEDTDYILNDWGIEILFPDGINKVTVNYDGGYTILPSAMYRALLVQTVYEWQNRDHIGSTSVTTEGGSVQRPELGLLKEAKRLLNKFRHPLKGVW